MTADGTTIHQCVSCPWRIDCDPDKDIPNYERELHAGLRKTIVNGAASLFRGTPIHVMSCHYSKPNAEFACAGWLHNQAGEGNNIAVRLGIMTRKYPMPVVDGEQHETFEDTLPKDQRPRTSPAALPKPRGPLPEPKIVCVYCERTRSVTKRGLVRQHKNPGTNKRCLGSNREAAGFPLGPTPFKAPK